jgi:hypothetical protein
MKALDFADCTFNKQRIANIAKELMRQKEQKRDFVYPANQLSYTDAGELVMNATERGFDVDGRVFFSWEDAERAADEAKAEDRDSTIKPIDGAPAIPLNGTAAGQLASRLDVPAKFIKKLRSKEYDDVIGNLFRDLLQRDSRRFLIRTLDGNARAVLSDRYRILDNADLFFAAFETFKEVGAEAWKARLWDDGFELFATADHISGEVTTDRTFDPGDGWASRWHGESGDAHNAAIRIRNSETGNGGLGVNFAIMRKVCANFNVWTEGVSQVHIGRTNDADGILYSDETREQESKAIWMKIRDCIKTGFNADKFAEYIAKLNGATLDVIQKPTEAVDNFVKAYAISEERRDSILEELLSSGDRSRFGLCQAVTSTAHKLDAAGDASTASQFEAIGAELIETDSDKFAAMIGG